MTYSGKDHRVNLQDPCEMDKVKNLLEQYSVWVRLSYLHDSAFWVKGKDYSAIFYPLCVSPFTIKSDSIDFLHVKV